MSRVEIYAIRPDGDVRAYDEAYNASAGALHIWETLARKHLGRSMDIWKPEAEQAPVHTLIDSPRMEEWERIALAFTFDCSWARKDQLPRLAGALEEFWRQHHRARGPDGREFDVTPTIAEVAAIVRRAVFRHDVRGLCFNQTSVCVNPWKVLVDPTVPIEEYDATRPFNFDRDTETRDGEKPRNIFALVDHVAA